MMFSKCFRGGTSDWKSVNRGEQGVAGNDMRCCAVDDDEEGEAVVVVELVALPAKTEVVLRQPLGDNPPPVPPPTGEWKAVFDAEAVAIGSIPSLVSEIEEEEAGTVRLVVCCCVLCCCGGGGWSTASAGRLWTELLPSLPVVKFSSDTIDR